MPFALTPIIWAIFASSILVGAWWVVDEIGDRREAKVEARLLPKINEARAERDQWKAAHQTLLDDAAKKDDENKELLDAALKAKAEAEKAYGGGTAPAVRVRPRAKVAPAAAGKNSGSGPGLQWLPALFGGGGKG